MYTVGDLLRRARRAKGLSIEEVAKRLHVRPSYLQALEVDDLNVFKSPTYVKGLVKSYCNIVDVDYNRILPFLRRQLNEEEVVITKKLTPIQVKNFQFGVMHLLILGLVIVIGIVLFLVARAYVKTLAPPVLKIIQPESAEFITDNPSLTIKGVTEDKTVVYVNGQQVTLKEDYSFETQVSLVEGENIITVEAVKTYAQNRKNTVEIKAVYTPAAKEEQQAQPAEPQNQTARFVLEVTADRAWILVRADQKQLDVGIKTAGYKKEFEAQEYFEVITGKPSVTRITLEGKELKWKVQDGKIYVKCQSTAQGWECE